MTQLKPRHGVARTLTVIGYALFPYFLAFGTWTTRDVQRTSRVRLEVGFLAAIVVSSAIPAVLLPRTGEAVALLLYYAGAALVIVVRALFVRTPGHPVRLPEPLDSRLGGLLAAVVPLAIIAMVVSPAIRPMLNAFRTAVPSL